MPDTWSKAHIAAGLATTVVSKVPGCTLGAIVINTKGSGANTITVYDDVSAVAANIVAIIDGTVAAAPYDFNCYMNSGITIVSATGVGCDMTVTFR